MTPETIAELRSAANRLVRYDLADWQGPTGDEEDMRAAITVARGLLDLLAERWNAQETIDLYRRTYKLVAAGNKSLNEQIQAMLPPADDAEPVELGIASQSLNGWRRVEVRIAGVGRIAAYLVIVRSEDPKAIREGDVYLRDVRTKGDVRRLCIALDEFADQE